MKRHGNVSRWVTVDCDQMMIRVTVKKKNKKKDKKELVNTRTAVTYRRTFSPTPSTPPRRLPFNAALDYGVLFLSWNLPIFLIFFPFVFLDFFFRAPRRRFLPASVAIVVVVAVLFFFLPTTTMSSICHRGLTEVGLLG